MEKSFGGGIVDICYRDLGFVRINILLKKICLQKESRMWLILDLYSLSVNEQWVYEFGSRAVCYAAIAKGRGGAQRK